MNGWVGGLWNDRFFTSMVMMMVNGFMSGLMNERGGK